MALVKETEMDNQIEIVGPFKIIQIRALQRVMEDGVELSRGFHRRSHAPRVMDENGQWVDNPLTGESAQVQAIAAAVWTSDIRAAYQAAEEANITRAEGA
jgi:hypothetical protein